MTPQRRRRDWSEEASCIGVFNNSDIKKLCGECPVLAECLNYAIVHENYGYWGGTNETQRRELRSRNLETLGYQAVAEGWLEAESMLTAEQVGEYKALAETEQKSAEPDLEVQSPEQIDQTLAQLFALEFDFGFPQPERETA